MSIKLSIYPFALKSKKLSFLSNNNLIPTFINFKEIAQTIIIIIEIKETKLYITIKEVLSN